MQSTPCIGNNSKLNSALTIRTLCLKSILKKKMRREDDYWNISFQKVPFWMMRIEWDSQVSSKVYTGCIYPLLLDPLGYMSGVMGRVWFGFGANYQFNVCTDHWWLESSYWCYFACWPMEKYHVQLPEKKRVSCHFACYLIIFFPFELYSCVAIQVALSLYNKFFLFWSVTWLKAATSWLQQWHLPTLLHILFLF